MRTKPTYKVYIDEAGDEGFVFRPREQGSSRWLVLSATVIRAQNNLQLVQTAKAARTLLGKPDKIPLHFRHLKHEQRIPVSAHDRGASNKDDQHPCPQALDQ